MAEDLHNIRNIGIIAHIDAGKTTVTERMLYYSGTSHRMGEVDKGTTVTDYDPEEQQRGITIQSACVTFDWKHCKINLIDTPGHVDFTAEVERSLRVLDGGVVVFSAREGVEAQSETVWRQADKYHVPRLAFINKMDREGADFYATLEEIRRRLDARPLALQIPVGVGPAHVAGGFRGIIDLVGMQFLTFSDAALGAEISRTDLPPELAEDAQLWRGQMLDDLFDYSNELAELMLADEPVPAELVRRVIREAALHQMVVPVLCGSALHYVGVQPLLDGVVDYLPSPADVPPVEGVDPGHPDRKQKRKPSTDEPFCGLVFKIQADKHGDLCYVRVYSGRLAAGTRVFNPMRNKKENVSQLWHIQADRRTQVASVEAGDIVGVIGLPNSITGDTLCETQHPILLESIVFPETVISMAIEPETSAERKKLSEALEMLKRQDPTFEAREHEETGQMLIYGMGELHLETIQNKLKRDFRVDVRVHKPRVSYRETVASAVNVTGECHKQVGGQSLSAKLTIRVEPYEDPNQPVVVACAIGPDEVPRPLLEAALEVLREQAGGGGSLGIPLLNVRITVVGAEVHETESNEVAFRVAAGDAFAKGLKAAGIVLLEPVMRLEIATPEEHVGDFVSDLQQRRGMVTNTHVRGRLTIIEAKAPLAALFGYSNSLRSLSQGRATCTMEPAEYAPAPPQVLESFL